VGGGLAAADAAEAGNDPMIHDAQSNPLTTSAMCLLKVDEVPTPVPPRCSADTHSEVRLELPELSRSIAASGGHDKPHCSTPRSGLTTQQAITLVVQHDALGRSDDEDQEWRIPNGAICSLGRTSLVDRGMRAPHKCSPCVAYRVSRA
jgi:hypothetical protein